MIPVRLQLKNFLPYRSPDPIYFEGIHLAALVGSNGAGKSSLLDAITWVLWGKARARRDDDLVHLGQSEMFVQLDFEQEGSTYRVIRRRKAGKRGTGSLDVFIVQEDEQLRLINEPSMRQTQTKIDEILRLDHETFVNSAFLQQGKADAFTTKTPAERKSILSDILGLDQWAVYEERTKERLKATDALIAGIQYNIQIIDEELAQQPRYEREKQAATATHEAAQQALQQAEALLKAVQDAPADLRNAQSTEAASKQRLQGLQHDWQTVAAQIEKQQQVILHLEQTIQEADAIEAGYQTLQQAREADSTLGAKLREMSDLNQQINALERDIVAERNQLEQKQASFTSTVREAQRLLQNDASEEFTIVQGRIGELEKVEQQRDALQEALVNLKEERSGLMARHETLKEEGILMNERIDALQQAEGANCPLCGQPLAEEHLERTLAELTQERDEKREHYRQAIARMNDIAEEAKAAQEQLDAIARTLLELPPLRGQLGALQQQVQDAQAAQIRLDEANAGLEVVVAALEQDDYAHETRLQLATLRDQREAIGYDRATHDSIQNTLSDYSQYEAQHIRLQSARESLPREHELLASYAERQERLHMVITEEEQAVQDIQEQIQRLLGLVEEFNRRQQEVLRLRTEEAQARERVIIAEQQLSSIERNRKRKETLQAQFQQAEAQRDVYQELRQAFGKNGVPAMIIEAAIPELETAANDLLARMTDGRMHLRLSTQRAKASGQGTIETLDIDIADELGTRPYEMYSGGEAFRINFAIRVALSKMLARRAGAHLRTLFVDEGFGTQDDDGRNKLVEAITAIQSDFDLILVITHIEELRDAFPVHIMVDKTTTGSMVRMR